MADVPTAAQVLAVLDTFDWDAWAATLDDTYRPIARDIVLASATKVFDGFTFDDPFATEWFTDYVGARIVQLNGTTRDEVTALVRKAIADGTASSPMALAQQIKALVETKFEEDYATWRALRIARTECGTVYNAGTVLGLKQAGVTHVLVSDGIEDDCAEANGAVWTVDYALDHLLGHVNCTRTFSPALDA